MPSDRSRVIDRPEHGYVAPVAQQGRVILDRDFNAWQGFAQARMDADALDFVGPCGTPDDGFAIALPPASPPGNAWSPPAPESPPSGVGQGNDFLIAGGTMYLGGQRVSWPVTQNGQAITYSYADQPELPPPAPLFQFELLRRPTQELVYLDVTLQEVSATEDSDLLDVALGGPDTTQRLRQRARVERQGVDGAGCMTAWAQMVANWAAQGLNFDPATMRLSPAVRLQVGFTQDASTGDPCDPVASGGYLGADNQLIRVRVAGEMLVWGYDNASFLYRIAEVGADGKTLTLASAPPDAAHYPQTGQIVEILPTGTVIGEEPDVSGTPGAPPILRVAAQAEGTLFSLAQPYGPSAQGAPTIVLGSALPGNLAGSSLPLFLRVWQAQLPLVIGTPIVLEDPSTGISTGVEVTLSGADVAADGAFWQIAVRPATPQGVYPEALLSAPQPADGPARFACPLAVIDWTNGPSLSDCRNLFDNLVTLSRRKPGCCTVNVSPGDLAGGVTLQTIIDGAVANGASAVICLAPGIYPLAAPLSLSALHDRITLECCGGVAELGIAPGGDVSLFGDGLIGLNGAFQVRLRGLSFVPPIVPFSASLLASLTSRLASEGDQAQVSGALRSPSSCIAIHAWNAAELSLRECTVLFPASSNPLLDLMAAGLLLQGNCSGLTVRDCDFGAQSAPTYSPIAQTNAYASLVPAERMNFLSPAAAVKQAVTVPGAAAPAPAPAPAVPVPGVFNAAQEIFSGTAVAKLAASRDAASFASMQRKMIASCGILAMTYGQPPKGSEVRGNDFTATLTNCVLDGAVIQGNVFTGLTFGMLAVADAGVMRVQDNNISGGVAGIWFSLSNNVTPANLLAGTDDYYNTISEFEEFQMLFGVAAILPPPSAGAQFVARKAMRAAPAGMYATLLISNNHVLTGPHPPPRTDGPAITGTAALVLWLDTDLSALGSADVEISAVVTGNHMLTAAANEPSALLVLADGQACAVTGNVIINQPGFQDSVKPSLWAVISNSAQTTQPIAVSGNVLRGGSDIGVLNRTGAAARGGWSGYNADPF